MSHNKLKIGGQEPSVSGEINQSIENLSNVSSSVITNGALIFDGSSFRSKGRPTTQEERYYSFIKTTDDYGTSSSYSNNDYWIWRHHSNVVEFKDSSVTTNSATTTNSPISNTKWTESLTLTDSGTYLLMASVTFGDDFTSNDSASLQWSDGSVLSNKIHINSEGVFGSMIWAIKSITSSTTFRLIVTDKVGTCRPIAGEQALGCTVQVLKLNT